MTINYLSDNNPSYEEIINMKKKMKFIYYNYNFF